MALTQRTVLYGEPALRALGEAISRLQAGDPLAPVTVLVHSNAVGVAARRWLAAHGGVAAAQFLTAFRLAELLGGPSLAGAGRRPVSTPVVEVAARAVLAEAGGIFRPIAAHQATVAALRTTYRELRHVPSAGWQVLAARGSARATATIELCRTLGRRLRRDWYDEADLLAAATGAVGSAEAVRAAGVQRTVVFLPQRWRSTEQALVDALATHAEVELIVGAEPGTDQGTEPGAGPMSLDIVDASDADDEVREAVRQVVGAAHRGTPLHRIAIAWSADLPYARLVGEHLDDAGVPWNGRPGIALHERLAARLVLDVFRLDRRGIRRTDLFALLSHVPARGVDGAYLPRQRWERISREAGLAGDADWDVRLQHFIDAARLRDRDADAESAQALRAFVADLRATLGPATAERPWTEWTSVAHGLLTTWLGGQRGLAALPPDELDAHGRVQASLDRLSHLDGLTGPVTREVVAATLEAELASAPGRVGRVGAGVQAGPLAFVVGHTVDLLVVVGACEGVLPSPPPDEALLTDHDRALTNGALQVDADRLAEQRHQLWAAVAGAERVVLLWPRGDLRATAVRQPSRWLCELAELVGSESRRSVPSFAAGLADVQFPATVAQHRVRALWHAAATGVDVASHPLVGSIPALRHAAPLIAARASAEFTPYDGDISSLGLDPLGAAPMSPTRLEGWVSCPHAWFVQHVLRVEPVEQPDEQLQITPKDRGNLVHEALDQFHRQVIAGALPQPGPHGWSPVHEAALLGCFATAAQGLERLGLVGRSAFWHTEQDRQRAELVDWLRVDGQLAAERGATVLASEHRFGFGDVPPAAIILADGTTLQFRGSVDRIDRCADGTLVVTDHKTGSATSYRDITDADPTAGGSRLQLPAYAAAARALVGATADSAVTAEYGFFGLGGYKRIGSVIGAHNTDTVEAALAHIINGIRSGVFVARPEKAQYRLSFVRCPYCDPDGLGTAELWAQTDRKMADPRVAALLAAGTGAEESS